MLSDQIKMLEDSLELESMELAELEDNVREVKKRISLTKAAHKRLVGLNEQLSA